MTFKYARYFPRPARARQVYGSDVLYERALSVGRYCPERSAARPAVRPPGPAADNLRGPVPAAGTYLVAAPEK